MNINELIEDIIMDLANNKTLDSVVSKVQVISRLLKNHEFTKWVNCEFTNGYKNDSEVPPYRRFFILGVNATYVEHLGLGGAVKYSNQQVPIENLGVKLYNKIAEVTIKDTISIIQQAINKDNNIHLSLLPYEKFHIQEVLGNCQIMSMYKVVSSQSFQNIIEQTKAKLIDVFMGLNETILENELNFNVISKKNDIQRIVNNYINAGIVNTGTGSIDVKESNVIGGGKNNVTISTEARHQLNDIVNQIEKLSKEIDEDRTDIADAIITIREELEEKMPRSKFLRTAFNSLKAIGNGIVVDKIIEYVNQALEVIPK